MRSAAEIVNLAANRAWTPPPSLSLAEWADANRRLGADGPEQGKYRSARTPYIRQPMEVLSPSHPARHVAIEKCTQAGLTEMAVNWIGYIIDLAPASTMITLPSEGVAKEWSDQRLAQLIEETECLHGKIQDARRRSSTGSTFSKRIKGTSAAIKLAWTTSGKKLRSTPAGNLISDEVDAFVGDVDGEGDPLYIIDCRMENFPRGKHLKISSPTHTPSRIHREFQRGDQRYFFVPCPYCGHYQALSFRRLWWPDPPRAEAQLERMARCAQAAYICVACEQRIPERFKTQMLAGGVWAAIATVPELRRTGFAATGMRDLALVFAQMEQAIYVSFHLSALYKPLGWKGAAWGQLALDWEAAEADAKLGQQGLRKVFINTKLAEVWVERGEAPDSDAVYGKREDYPIGVVPAGGLFLTLAVDQQRNPARLEWEVKAWGRNYESWSVAANTISGDPGEDKVWAEIDKVIQRAWPHANGGSLPIQAAGIDTGWNPQKAYDFCSRFPQPAYGPAGAKICAVRTVVPIKGGHDWQKAIEGFGSIEGARKRDGLRIVTLGSSYLKQEVYNAIRRPRPEPNTAAPGYWHYPHYHISWFQGLCSESRDGNKWIWDKRFRNEPLDLGGYNLGLAELCGIRSLPESEWLRLEQSTRPAAVTQSKPVQKKDGGDDWLRGRGDDWF